VVTRARPDLAAARAAAAAVPDPELPMVTVADLGILRDVSEDGGQLVVTITPTYSGCPATGSPPTAAASSGPRASPRRTPRRAATAPSR
jgi:metal-sulfur cluster biosynthetic enzyme